MMKRFMLTAAILMGLIPMVTQAQAPAVSTGAGRIDPLAIGKSAMEHGDYQSAQKFFAEFVQDNPDSMEAVFYLGGSELGLKNFSAAAVDFQRIIAVMPNQWSAHSNLALSYAQAGDWAAFDKERAVIKAARDTNAPGVDKDGYDLIDKVSVGEKTYEVRAFYKLHGKYNVRYVFLHFGQDGNADSWVQCESDDVDQAFFKGKAGERRYSLDTYSFSEKGGLSQGLIKFYDGEPTYETVRADALKTLSSAADSKKNPDVKK
jgi:tetratricopeptide (TPR) repeat protein